MAEDPSREPSEEEPAEQSSRVEQSSEEEMAIESSEEDLPVTVEESRWDECPLLHSSPASPSLLHLDGSYSPFYTDFGTSLTRHVT